MSSVLFFIILHVYIIIFKTTFRKQVKTIKTCSLRIVCFLENRKLFSKTVAK